MSRLKLIVIVLLSVAAVQLALLLGLTLLFYQVTPKSTLAQSTFIGRMQPLLLGVRLADRSLNLLYRGPTPPEELPLYHIRIAEGDLEDIEKEIAKTDVFITDDAKLWVPATFVSDGEEHEVQMRIRGDRFNHWKFRKKSWRVKFAKEHLHEGMRQVSLIIPEDRGWFAEALNTYRARKLNLLQPSMRFVTASINGSKPLVYLEVEHWTKEMLEKQARPGDINFYKTGGVGTSSFNGWDPIFEDMAYWSKFTESLASPHDSYEELDMFFSLIEPGAHKQPNFKEKVQTLFDIEQLVRWYAHSLLSGNLHVGGDNLRFIFDSSRGRFEPIPWDVFLIPPRSLFSLPGNPLWDEVFAVPEWRLAVYQFLWDYVQEGGESDMDREEAARLRALIERAAYRDPHKLQSNRQIKNDLDARSGEVLANIEFLREQLQLSELLVTQRLPSNTEQAKGVGLILDVIVRGPVAATFSGVLLPLSVLEEEELIFIRDDGNGMSGTEDAVLSYERIQSKTHDVIIFNESDTLISPEQPEVNEIGEPTEAPHTRYRFFVKGLNKVEVNNLPLSLDLRNAVTNASAQIIRTTVVDDSLYQDSVPELP